MPFSARGRGALRRFSNALMPTFPVEVPSLWVSPQHVFELVDRRVAIRESEIGSQLVADKDDPMSASSIGKLRFQAPVHITGVSPNNRSNLSRIDGVVADVPASCIDRGAHSLPSTPYWEQTLQTFAISSSNEIMAPPAAIPSIRHAIRDLAPALPIGEFRTMARVHLGLGGSASFSAHAALRICARCLTLACVGIYGVQSPIRRYTELRKLVSA